MAASENGVVGARSDGRDSAAGAGRVTPSSRIRTWAIDTSGTRMTNSATRLMTRWAAIGKRTKAGDDGSTVHPHVACGGSEQEP